MFNPAYELARAKPASYNPRRIDEASLEALRASLTTLGLIRPIIVTSEDTIVAGHQRTKAMRSLGFERCPAYILPPVSITDEIRFNQIHNAGDQELADADLRVPAAATEGWAVVPAGQIEERARPRFAAKRNEVLRLLTKYGEWGSAVATLDGRLIVGQVYGSARRAQQQPLRVYYLSHEKADLARSCFGRSYGSFSYDHLPKTTWAQTLAQKHRLRSDKQGGHSRTYEKLVLPILRKSWRILDFGAGQMDYVRHLGRLGFAILGVEFYRRRPATMELDLDAIQADISAVCRDLTAHGLFDLVVCDSVLNSVDSVQAEADVLTCLNALCRPGGTVVFSGRRQEEQDYREHRMKSVLKTRKKDISFQDADGLTAMYQRGVWLYQKFHTQAQAVELARRFIGSRPTYLDNDTSWSISVVKDRRLPAEEIEASLAREFNLPLPEGRTIGRAQDILKAFRAATAPPH